MQVLLQMEKSAVPHLKIVNSSSKTLPRDRVQRLCHRRRLLLSQTKPCSPRDQVLIKAKSVLLAVMIPKVSLLYSHLVTAKATRIKLKIPNKA